jgi:hypothetical protein
VPTATRSGLHLYPLDGMAAATTAVVVALGVIMAMVTIARDIIADMVNMDIIVNIATK